MHKKSPCKSKIITKNPQIVMCFQGTSDINYIKSLFMFNFTAQSASPMVDNASETESTK